VRRRRPIRTFNARKRHKIDIDSTTDADPPVSMSTICTADLSGLPSPPPLKALFQSLAILDAIMSPEWEYRYYSYDAKWGPGETMGSMRNGSGDELFALFDANGCFIKGFSHEHWLSDVPSREFYQSVPKEFSSGVSEPAFRPDHVTFCYWRLEGADRWEHAQVSLPRFDDPDGSAFLMRGLDGKPGTYRSFAEDYYERSLPMSSVSAIYDHQVLTEDLVRSLNPDSSLADLTVELASIGYPFDATA